MINPPPRPALRKAPDADVHPVAAVPAMLPAPRRVTTPGLRPVIGMGGRTSDTLTPRTKKTKRTTLDVKVPKYLVKSAKQRAKSRGDRLDDVVTAALLNYVDGM